LAITVPRWTWSPFLTKQLVAMPRGACAWRLPHPARARVPCCIPAGSLPCRATRSNPVSVTVTLPDGGHLQEPGLRLCGEIDERVQTFLSRPIEGEWPYVWLDARQTCWPTWASRLSTAPSCTPRMRSTSLSGASCYQPARAAQRRDQATQRGRRHLSQRGCCDPLGRRLAAGTERRMGRPTRPYMSLETIAPLSDAPIVTLPTVAA
jgi:hypothetical protein